jgi:hypothetical protein
MLAFECPSYHKVVCSKPGYSACHTGTTCVDLIFHKQSPDGYFYRSIQTRVASEKTSLGSFVLLRLKAEVLLTWTSFCSGTQCQNLASFEPLVWSDKDNNT